MSEQDKRGPDFDLNRSLERAKPGWFDKITWSEVPNFPISKELLICIQYMARVEGHTIYYLRHPLASTDVMQDPATTEFLSIWPAQELWHGIALYRFLNIYEAGRFDQNVHSTRYEDMHEQRAAMSFAQKHSNLGSAALSHMLPKPFTAAYATIGYTNEQSTLFGYRRIDELAEHPVLSQILQNVKSEEANHSNYYESLARRKLEGDRKAQLFTRLMMGYLWTPVGEGYRPEQEAIHVVATLFPEGSRDLLIQAINTNVNDLPGLAGGDYVAKKIDRMLLKAA